MCGECEDDYTRKMKYRPISKGVGHDPNALPDKRGGKRKGREDPLAQACSPLIPLCRELLRILDIKEESDSGRSFHPTTIQSCRTMDLEKLRDTLSGIRDYLENGKDQS